MLSPGLSSHDLTCEDVKYCVATHGHSDHLGNLNLFTAARHIIGFTVSFENEFFIHPFETGQYSVYCTFWVCGDENSRLRLLLYHNIFSWVIKNTVIVVTGEPYKIDDSLQIIPTPGHTTADVSVVVNTEDLGTVVIAG